MNLKLIRVDNVDIVKTKVVFPRSAAKLEALLRKYSPREQ